MGQLGQVLGNVDAPCVEIQVLDCLSLLARAEDDPKRSLLRRLALMPVEPVQVELHLARVRGPEVTDLQLDGYETLHSPMEEQQVEVVVITIERDSLLPRDEREAGPQLQEEVLDLPQDGGLEVPFAVRVCDVEEVQDIWIAEDQRR